MKSAGGRCVVAGALQQGSRTTAQERNTYLLTTDAGHLARALTPARLLRPNGTATLWVMARCARRDESMRGDAFAETAIFLEERGISLDADAGRLLVAWSRAVRSLVVWTPQSPCAFEVEPRASALGGVSAGRRACSGCSARRCGWCWRAIPTALLSLGVIVPPQACQLLSGQEACALAQSAVRGS